MAALLELGDDPAADHARRAEDDNPHLGSSLASSALRYERPATERDTHALVVRSP
jgi:hypothetical protein